jgi:calcium binding protein 39
MNLLPLGAGYEHQEIALNCGTMLRECVRFEALAKIVLHSEHFFHFFKYVEVSTFDIASDAFATFKELLTRHKMLAADFLEANYDQVEKVTAFCCLQKPYAIMQEKFSFCIFFQCPVSGKT